MYKDKKNNEETMFTLREWLKDYNTETNIWLDFSNNEARFCRAKDVVETDGEFHEYATYYVNKVKLSDYRMEPQFILQEPFSVNNNITVKNDIEYNDDREKELHNIIGMMCSEDYQDRFKAEYLQLKMRYNKLHNMIIKYEAGKLNFKPKCDIELLKRQKAAMGQYLYYLEVRAEIENIDLNKCFT